MRLAMTWFWCVERTVGDAGPYGVERRAGRSLRGIVGEKRAEIYLKLSKFCFGVCKWGMGVDFCVGGV